MGLLLSTENLQYSGQQVVQVPNTHMEVAVVAPRSFGYYRETCVLSLSFLSSIRQTWGMSALS